MRGERGLDLSGGLVVAVAVAVAVVLGRWVRRKENGVYWMGRLLFEELGVDVDEEGGKEEARP